ncbi:DNA-directed RNA polymerase III subunit RPC9 [Chironomus tepperi]|uniref:DNA-directed RNA polymerase III subunit RPC9 n=1 Tax=Chironomus tepperi TaxID=113505 RepID=UPI00391F2DE3
MEILNPKLQVLTNQEVLQALRQIKDQKNSHSTRNLATITYETIQYLENTPCKDQTQENIENFIVEAQKFGRLTKSEVLTMINDPPTLPLHIQLVVEDSEERLTETQVDELIELSKKYLHPNSTNTG